MSTATNVNLTKGTLRMGQRPASVHPGWWDGKLDKLQPLAKFPLIATIDRLPEGEKAKSVRQAFFYKAYNALIGNIDSVYDDQAFGTPFSTDNAAIGASVVVKPTTDDKVRLYNCQEGQQIIIHSTSKNGMVKGIITAVVTDGVKPQMTVRLITADSKNVLKGTGLTWALGVGSESEIFELGRAVNQHEDELFNYIYTDSQPFAMSRRELREYSRIIEDKKKERELDALEALNWRRETNVLEGVRVVDGDKYYAGGLRFFLEDKEPLNIRDWTTDHNASDGGLSSKNDKVLTGTIPMIIRALNKRRKYSEPGATVVIETSNYVRGLLNECARQMGNYNVEYGTNKMGMQVDYLRGTDAEVEIWENPQLDHAPAFMRSAYILEPKQIKRHTPEDSESNASKGLEYVPWSSPKKANGETFKSRMKGGWIAEETYTFRRLPAHMIIDNLGLPKVA